MSFNCCCRDFENLEKSKAMGCCFMGASDGWSDSKSTKLATVRGLAASLREIVLLQGCWNADNT